MNSMEDGRRNPGSRPWTFDDCRYQLWTVVFHFKCVPVARPPYIQPSGGFFREKIDYCLLRTAADIKVRAYQFLQHSLILFEEIGSFWTVLFSQFFIKIILLYVNLFKLNAAHYNPMF